MLSVNWIWSINAFSSFSFFFFTQVMKAFQNETEQNLTEKENSLLKEVNPDDLVLLKTMFMEVEKSIDEITLMQENDKKSKTFDGSHIFNILERSHVCTFFA